MIPKTDGVHIHNILPKSICDLDKALQWLIANTTITIRSQKDGLRTVCNSSIPGRALILSYILKEAYLNARDNDIVTDKLVTLIKYLKMTSSANVSHVRRTIN